MSVISLLRSAQIKTGLRYWGERDFTARLDVWLTAIDRDAGLSQSGRRQLDAYTLNHACNRLMLEALIARFPQIEAVELEPPIVVTGLPRSGTTALARRLAKECDARWLPYWQALQPFSSLDEAAKRRDARKANDLLCLLAPRLAKLHDSRENAFVDDTELQCLAFGSYAIEWHAHVPRWRDFYLSEDHEPVYRYLKRAMQALTFLDGEQRRWLIKSPQHMEQLPALKAVFPQASLIVAQRSRRDALRSMSNVMDAMTDGFRCRAFPSTYWPARFDGMVARYEAAKHIFPDRLELDVSEERASHHDR